MQYSGAGCAVYWGRICSILGQDMHYIGAGCAVYWGRICSIVGQDMQYIGAGYAVYWCRTCSIVGQDMQYIRSAFLIFLFMLQAPSTHPTLFHHPTFILLGTNNDFFAKIKETPEVT